MNIKSRLQALENRAPKADQCAPFRIVTLSGEAAAQARAEQGKAMAPSKGFARLIRVIEPADAGDE